MWFGHNCYFIFPGLRHQNGRDAIEMEYFYILFQALNHYSQVIGLHSFHSTQWWFIFHFITFSYGLELFTIYGDSKVSHNISAQTKWWQAPTNIKNGHAWEDIYWISFDNVIFKIKNILER